jgi:hypothetical protein
MLLLWSRSLLLAQVLLAKYELLSSLCFPLSLSIIRLLVQLCSTFDLRDVLTDKYSGNGNKYSGNLHAASYDKEILLRLLSFRELFLYRHIVLVRARVTLNNLLVSHKEYVQLVQRFLFLCSSVTFKLCAPCACSLSTFLMAGEL